MGVISIVGKIVLGIINSIFMMMGLAFVIIGIIIAAGSDVFVHLRDELEDELQDAATATGTDLNTSNLDLAELMYPCGIAMIFLGAFIFGVALVGTIATTCNLKYLMLVYAIIVSVLFLALFAIVLVIYIDDTAFDDTLKPYLKDTMVDYSDAEGEDSQSLIWNAVMNYAECCGVDDYEDFHHPRVTNWPPAGGVNNYSFRNQKTPILCCKTKSTNYNCAENDTATDAINYQNEGCYKKVYKDTTENEIIITFVVFTLALLATCMFFSIWIVMTHDNIVDIIKLFSCAVCCVAQNKMENL